MPLIPDAAEGNLSEVCAVVQHVQHGSTRPVPAVASANAASVEIVGDRRSCRPEGRKTRARQALTRSPILNPRDDVPAFLTGHVGVETVALGTERMRLVGLVGADAGVGADATSGRLSQSARSALSVSSAACRIGSRGLRLSWPRQIGYLPY